MPLRPLKTPTDYIACHHWRAWPPLAALEHPDQTGIEMYRNGDIDGVGLQRFQIWERDCGLFKMDESKCKTCPHVRRVVIQPPQVPMMVTMDGRTKIPIIDKTFAAALGQNRSQLNAAIRPDGTQHSKKDAAWVRARQKDTDA
jgi:hypothetical protein